MSGQDEASPARPTDTVPTRNIPIGVAAIVTVLVLGYVCWRTASAGGWWWPVFAVCAFIVVVASYGAVESFQKVPRDAKGDRIK